MLRLFQSYLIRSISRNSDVSIWSDLQGTPSSSASSTARPVETAAAAAAVDKDDDAPAHHSSPLSPPSPPTPLPQEDRPLRIPPTVEERQEDELPELHGVPVTREYLRERDFRRDIDSIYVLTSSLTSFELNDVLDLHVGGVKSFPDKNKK
ncbi:uncharacterized protein LOC116415781 [Nasonia vitripennis]|uniref:Uncharacterized protein n=1 Tax=Nasonia vitripennis TaxID=7425 RepID=A0A7M7PXV2_NASVI|nr:uncharacterized protein LOC116415781 [Nasonia vitripennis]